MRLSQIRYFLEVCQCGSITKASKILYVSQPSITVAIKDLEEELGINLFNRIRQRIFLTEEGKIFYEKLTKIVDDLDNLTEIMKDYGNKKKNVKIGVPPMIASFLFPEIFYGFKKLYPEINLELHEYGTIESRNLLLEEKLDLIIITGEHLKPHSMNFIPILQTSYNFYVGKNHHLANRSSIEFDDLKNEPITLFNKGFYIHKVVMEEFKNIGVDTPNIILKTSQVETVKKFILTGISGGFLTKDCVQESDDLVEVPFKNPRLITIGLEWKNGKYLCSDVANFIKYINETSKIKK